MAFIPTAGAVRVDVQFVLAGQQVHNILWFSREANWTGAERSALAAAIADWWNTSAKPYFSAAIGLSQITVVNQETASAPSTVLVVSPIVYGTGAGTCVPNGTALCATLRTDLRGRNYRGRTYLAGTLETYRADSISIISGYISSLLTVLGALKTAVEALGAIWVVVSHFVNKAPRAGGLKTPITAVSMDAYYDSQRRRLGLRGV